MFGDPNLNALIEQVEISNQNVLARGAVPPCPGDRGGVGAAILRTSCQRFDHPQPLADPA